MLAFNGVNQIKGRLKSFQTAFSLGSQTRLFGCFGFFAFFSKVFGVNFVVFAAFAYFFQRIVQHFDGCFVAFACSDTVVFDGEVRQGDEIQAFGRVVFHIVGNNRAVADYRIQTAVFQFFDNQGNAFKAGNFRIVVAQEFGTEKSPV